MPILRYSVTLDEEVVKETKKYLKGTGSKLSPIINNLLIGWNIKQKEILFLEENKNIEEEADGNIR